MNPGEYGIYAAHLNHTYGSGMVLNGASTAVRRGELYGLLGRNGAGKSTLIRALCGFMKPDSGEILVNGIDVIQNPVLVRRHIGVVSEDVEMYEKLSASEFLRFAGQMHGLSGRAAASRAEELMAMLELTPAADRAIHGFSLGMKKKTAFAAALIHAPSVLFLDEPFNGVDAASARSLCRLLKQLTEERGVTILLTSHVTEMIQKLCSRVEFLLEGKIVEEAAVREQYAPIVGQNAPLEDLLIAISGENNSTPALDWYQLAG